MMDSSFWRRLRADFTNLQPHKFGLMWTSVRPRSPQREHLKSSWSWVSIPDSSLAARLSSLSLLGAKALGYDSEDAWYDELRCSDFVGFGITTTGTQRRSDGAMMDLVSGEIDDVVKQSITLCHKLEAMCALRPTSAAASLPPSRFGGEITRRIAEGPILRSKFWTSVQVDFENYAKQYANLAANWRVKQRVWLLRWDATLECYDVPQQCKDVFNAISRRAATALPDSYTTGDGEPWHVWLNFMRDRPWSFKPTGTEACTEWESDARRQRWETAG